MIIFRAFGQIAMINLQSFFAKFLRLFSHSDRRSVPFSINSFAFSTIVTPLRARAFSGLDLKFCESALLFFRIQRRFIIRSSPFVGFVIDL